MQSMQKMGGFASILNMLPGMGLGNKLKDVDTDAAEEKLKKITVMIHSMTKYERSHPDCLNLSRKNRIARGSGVNIQEVHRMVKQFNETRELMKKMGNMKGGKNGRFKLPF